MAVYCLDDFNPAVEFANRYDLVRYLLVNVNVGDEVVVKCVPTFENIIISHNLNGWIVISESDSQIIVELLNETFNKLTV